MLLVCGEKNKSTFEALFGFLCEEKKKDLMFVCQGFCLFLLGFFYDSELSSWCGMSFQGKKKILSGSAALTTVMPR